MIENIILIILLCGLLLEIIYIIFRNPKINFLNLFVFSVAILLSLKTVYDSFILINFIKLFALILVLTAKIYFKNKPFEKPDYRYLLILIGTIIVNG
ncbi:MAG: hypothetical protein KKD38_06780 [Candidatus Delongbacteria bacterium]|nr:hypothetical protein [Candidatus Delongbacteria bacterium]MCG2760633.1 hypothetical protein [Candidatus Delongbacteria bacterium]